jgi:N12 class adenine-specific DNA methylase
VLAQRGGLVAFDVGVGKTYTALAIIARARQEGWVRRPVILVPGSLVWKWHDDILCTLPDYRVAVIGSKRKKISRGVRKGVITSETDTPQERAKKWTLLQTGQVDVVVLSYDALAGPR